MPSVSFRDTESNHMTITNSLFIRALDRLALVALLALPLSANSQGMLLRSAHAIDDDFRGYCLDVAGGGENARVDAALRTHTCKYGGANEDQLFHWTDDATGHIAMPEYDRCLETASIAPGAELFVHRCSDSARQSWALTPAGQISLRSRSDLCVTIAAERSPAGAPAWISPVFHRRDVTLELCESASETRQAMRWAPGDEQHDSLVSTRRRTVPDHIVAGIRELGNTMSPENMAKTQQLLADQPRVFEASEIEVVADLAYGPHDRHRLDVHTDNYRRSDVAMPVAMFVHGGGFLFGAKENERNVADYFASLGLVGVNATYRLAPEAVWPNGAEDIGAAVNWVRENIAAYGGDPEQIFVIGKSAGVEHVAAYVFQPNLLPPGTATVAGAVFLSGTYTPNSRAPTPGELAYFGEDTSQWSGKGILGNIDRADIPVLITVSEYDPPIYSQSLARTDPRTGDRSRPHAACRSTARTQPLLIERQYRDDGPNRELRDCGVHSRDD